MFRLSEIGRRPGPKGVGLFGKAGPARYGKAWVVNNFGKNLALWIVIGLLLVALFQLFQTSSTHGPQSTLAFSDFVTDVGNGHVTDGRAFSTYAPTDPNLVSRLIDKGVRITAAPLDENVPSLFSVIVSWF